MKSFGTGRVVAIGEAMVEMAPIGDAAYRQGFAGDTFNTVWHMAQLIGIHTPCGLVTRIGMDGLSERFLSGMARDGLDVTGVLRDAERQMGLYLIELDGVERSFHYWRKDSAARRLADDLPALEAALAGTSLIHLSGITLAILSPEARAGLISVLAGMRRGGTVISFDPNVRPRLWASREETREAMTAMLAETDIALPSFDDEAALWGDASPQATADRLSALGIAEVVVKDGGGPVCTRSEGRLAFHDTPPVTDIRDTTGAGDGFNAGYLSGRFSGRSVADSVRLGQALSAEVLRTPGALADRSRVHGLLAGAN